MRYPRLRVPEDFTHLFASWVHTLIPPTAGGHAGPFCVAPTELLSGSAPRSTALPLDSLPVLVVDHKHCLAADVPTLKDSVPAALTVVQGCLPVRYTVRVALLMDCGVQGVPEAVDSRQHLLQRIKCLVFSPGSPGRPSMQLPGAAWSRDVDGGDPSIEDACLVRTAVRAASTQAGIDLSTCCQWAKVLEVHYHRPLVEGPGVGTLNGSAEQPHHAELIDVCTILVPLDASRAARFYTADESGRWKQQEAASSTKEAASFSTAQVLDVHQLTSTSSEAKTDTTRDADEGALKARLSLLRYEELRSECRAAGLDATGRKLDLLQRLVAARAVPQKVDPKDVVLEDISDVDASTGDAPKVVAVQITEHADSAPQQALIDGPSIVHEVPLQAHVYPPPPAVACLIASTPLESKSSESVPTHNSPALKLVSLRRLLQYNETDLSEGIFELSVFAEAVNESLLRDLMRVFATSVARLPDPSASSSASSPRPQRDAIPDLVQSGTKRRRADGPSDDDNATSGVAEGLPEVSTSSNPQDPLAHADPTHGTAASAIPGLNATAPASADTSITPADPAVVERTEPPRNAALRLACAFIDRAGCGFLEARDLEDLLGRAGLHLSRGDVRRLVARAVGDPAYRSRTRCRLNEVVAAVEATSESALTGEK